MYVVVCAGINHLSVNGTFEHYVLVNDEMYLVSPLRMLQVIVKLFQTSTSTILLNRLVHIVYYILCCLRFTSKILDKAGSTVFYPLPPHRSPTRPASHCGHRGSEVSSRRDIASARRTTQIARLGRHMTVPSSVRRHSSRPPTSPIQRRPWFEGTCGQLPFDLQMERYGTVFYRAFLKKMRKI